MKPLVLGAGHLWVVGRKEPMRSECEVMYEIYRNECEVICKIFDILNCGCEFKQAMILAVMKAIYAMDAIAYIEA